MSYQVLARKWRPKTFSQVVGQEHILTALSNGLKENRLHHAYLFSGTRGVGKTSIARLFAKGLNCINGVTADPCGECEHCKAIEDGHFIDLIEIDAASRTKVEDTRELLDNVQYKPVQGRYKVYLIDEVHMLSRHSFNALLKTLEEPPEYVKFLLATTDPQKLPITILSRCMQFHLKALEPKQISQHLARILDAEKIPYESTALDKLAKSAQGSIRDSLSLTDQAIAMSNGDIRTDIVNQMLGLLDDNQPIEIVYSLHQGNGENLMKTLQAVAEKGADWDELLIEVETVLHQIAMQQLLPKSQNEDSQIGFLAKHISPEDVQFFYQTMLVGRKELAFAPDRRTGVEMTLLRALAFHPKHIQLAHQGKSLQNNSQTAVKKSEVLVDMPVVSQNLKAHSSALNPTPSSAVQTENNVANPTSNALNAINQINKLRSSLAQADDEKKKPDLTAEKFGNSRQPIELPVISSRPEKNSSEKSKGGDFLDRLANLGKPKTSTTNNPTNLAQSAVGNPEDLTDQLEDDKDDNNLNDAETYRWEWLNPEMAQEEECVRPSDIKQAILKEKTPELVEKVISLSEQRNDWEKLVGKLNLDDVRLVKQLALNSALLEQREQNIRLGLRSAHQHLLREQSLSVLTERLSTEFNQPISLNIEINDDNSLITPLECRQQIYQELSEQARQNLLNDPSLKLLQETFDAKLDMESIRPV